MEVRKVGAERFVRYRLSYGLVPDSPWDGRRMDAIVSETVSRRNLDRCVKDRIAPHSERSVLDSFYVAAEYRDGGFRQNEITFPPV